MNKPLTFTLSAGDGARVEIVQNGEFYDVVVNGRAVIDALQNPSKTLSLDEALSLAKEEILARLSFLA